MPVPLLNGTGIRFRYTLRARFRPPSIKAPMTHSVTVRRSSPTLTLSVLSLAALAYILLQSLVVPALPTIGEELGTTQSTVSWILTAYLLSASVATPILGRFGDIYGKKRILVAVLASLVVGSV